MVHPLAQAVVSPVSRWLANTKFGLVPPLGAGPSIGEPNLTRVANGVESVYRAVAGRST
jgi:hypothetical protein